MALWLPPGAEPDGDLLIGTLTDTVAADQHDVMFAVLGQMEEAHPAFPHWYLPWLGVDPAQQGRYYGFVRRRPLQEAEYQPDGPVDLSGLGSIETASEITEPSRVDGTHLIDEHAGPGPIHVDLRAENSGPRAGRGGGDDQRGQQNSIALDGHRIPRAALLMPSGVFREA